MTDSPGTEVANKPRVWEDPEESPEDVQEPDWLQKRRLLLESKKLQDYEVGEPGKEDSENRDGGLVYSGKLTRIKPGKFKSGIRFKITQVRPTKESLKIEGGVKEINFDQNRNHISFLSFKPNPLVLYNISHKSDDGTNKSLNAKTSDKRLGFKLKNRRELKFNNFATTGCAFKEDNLFLIGRNLKLLKYDLSQERGVDVSSIMVPRDEKAFKSIRTSDSNYYGISCVNTGFVALHKLDALEFVIRSHRTLLVCDYRSNLLVHNFKLGSECTGFGFAGNTLLSCDADSNIYEFDLTAGKCKHKFKDTHALSCSAFSLNQTFQNASKGTHEAGGRGVFGLGTKTGYVHLYSLGASNPFKKLDNLTTEITDLCVSEKFTAFSSLHKKNAVRILHNASLQLVANWPGPFNLGRVSTLSLLDDTLILGSKSGQIRFYHLLS